MNDTSTNDNLSTVHLYLGGIPTSEDLIIALYPVLVNVHSFNGCIRNVLSNGYYLNMSDSIRSENAYPGDCFAETDAIDTLIPWYTWLTITLVLLFLITLLLMILWILQRTNYKLKALTNLSMDDVVGNIIDYKLAIND